MSEAAHGSHRGAHAFVPALGLDWLTRFYDPLVRLTLREGEMRRRLIEQARIAPGMDVLDLGCGTGTQAILVARTVPGARVHGLDVDPAVLAIAREKIAAAGAPVELHQGTAADPELAAESFDRILTSLVLHHLTTAEKRAALGGAHRMLRPGGELHVADFGPPENALMGLVSLGVRWLDGSDRTEVNLSGRLPDLVREAGFARVEAHGTMMTPFGSLAFLSAAKRA